MQNHQTITLTPTTGSASAPEDFCLMSCDTDSIYFAISGESLEEVIRPELRAEFELEKSEYLVTSEENMRQDG